MGLKVKSLCCFIATLALLFNGVTAVFADSCYSTVYLLQNPFATDSDHPVYVMTDTEYSLTFSDALDTNSAEASVLYLNYNELTDSDAEVSVSKSTFKIKFKEPALVSGVEYRLDINGLKDSSGKYITIEPMYVKAAGNVPVIWETYLKKGDQKVRFNGTVNGKIGVEAKTENNTVSDLELELVCEIENGSKEPVFIKDSATLLKGEEKTLACEFDVESDERVFAYLCKSNGEIVTKKFCVTENTVPTSYYLTDDRFGNIIVDARGMPLLSGWRINRGTKENNVGHTAFAGVTLTDNSASNSVSMEKSFLCQSSGILTLETGFSLDNGVGKFEITLDGYRNDERVSAVKISTTKSKVTVFDGINRVEAATLTADSVYNFKITANLDSRTFSVYLNGRLIKENAEFYQNADFLSFIKISTPGIGKVAADVNYVRLYKNYGTNETFMCSGDALDEWSKSMSNINVTRQYGVSDSDSYCVALGSGMLSGVITKVLDYSPQNPELSFAFKLSDQSTLNVDAFGVSEIMKIIDKSLSAGSASYELESGVWYDARLSKSGSNATIYINGISIGIVDAGSDGDTVSFSGEYGVLLDDISVREKPANTSLSVIKPVDDSVDIHMMNYPMWNEGTHYGWDRISEYPERSPLMGFYDDCNEEAMNLQIKWLAEHSVDTVVFPFARFSGNKNSPVKNSQRDDALKAYKNAELSGEIKYAVMWSAVTSSTFGGSDDFRNNIVPYWVEQYFKDPRYATVDNKPILYIYNPDNIISILGSEENFKAELDYLDTEVQKLGFDGVYVVCNLETKSLKNIGVDGIFSYAITTNGGVAITQNQGNNILEGYSKLYNTEFITCAYMGFDTLPWRGNSEGKGTTVTPSAFKNRLLSIKAEMISNQTAKKILYLGTWNEYGEGHYFMPTYLYGFSYLDAVREVFGGDSSEHTDYVPNYTEQRRYGTMYTKLGTPSRRYEKKVDSSATDNLTVVKGWYFDSYDDRKQWVASYATKSAPEKTMVLTSTSSTDEPELTADVSSLGIKADDVKYIRVTLKTDLAKINGSVFTMHFTTEKIQEMYKNTSFREPLISDNMRTILIDTSNNPTWTGTLQKLKIWPVYVAQKNCEVGTKYEIAAIELLK